MSNATDVVKVMVVNSRFASLDAEREVFAGHELVSVDVPDADALFPEAETAQAILITSTPVLDAAAIARLRACKVIVRYGIGVDNVALDAAASRGITVCNVPDYCLEEVSTFAVLLALACNRSLLKAVQLAGAGQWGAGGLGDVQAAGTQVMGILGFGEIARRTARKSSALGFTVHAHDPFVEDEDIRREDVLPVAFDELLAGADILSIHTPLTEATRGLIGPAQLALMKDTAYIVNTARGGIVSEEALLDALDAGQLAGAALDVLAAEPPPHDHPLLGHPKVIVTPHIAWYSRQALERLQRGAAEEALRVLQGAVPVHPVVRP